MQAADTCSKYAGYIDRATKMSVALTKNKDIGSTLQMLYTTLYAPDRTLKEYADHSADLCRILQHADMTQKKAPDNIVRLCLIIMHRLYIATEKHLSLTYSKNSIVTSIKKTFDYINTILQRYSALINDSEELTKARKRRAKKLLELEPIFDAILDGKTETKTGIFLFGTSLMPRDPQNNWNPTAVLKKRPISTTPETNPASEKARTGSTGSASSTSVTSPPAAPPAPKIGPTPHAEPTTGGFVDDFSL